MPRQGEQQGHDPCCQTTVEVGIRQSRSFRTKLECTPWIIRKRQSDRSSTEHTFASATLDRGERTQLTINDGFTQARVSKMRCERRARCPISVCSMQLDQEIEIRRASRRISFFESRDRRPQHLC